MTDTPDTSVTLDLSKMTEAELRAEYARLSTSIKTLMEAPKTIQNAQAINALRTERNLYSTAVRDLRALSVESDEDVPLDAADAGATVADALTTEAPADEPAADAEPAAPEAPAAEAAAPEAPAAEEPAAAPAVAEQPAPEAPAPAADAPAAEAPEATVPATGAAPEVAEQGGDTPTPHDGPTNTNGGTPVADTPAPNTPEPSVEDTASVVAEAERLIAASANDLVGAAGPVTASLSSVHDQRPVVAGLAERPQVGYMAKGGQTTFAEGTHLDMEGMRQVISEIISSGRDSGKGIVAALPSFEVTQGMLHEILDQSSMSAAQATALIDDTVAAHMRRRDLIIKGDLASIDPVTAAICTPLDIIRDVPECGVTDTPFSDIFPQRGVGRLGFQFFPQMALIDTDEAVNVWNEDNQVLVDEGDPTTWKPSPLIQCLPAVSVTAEELVASARVDLSTQISQPEQVVQFMHKLAVQRARRREQYLQGKYDALASGYTHAGYYGALVSLLETGELLERLVYGERLDPGDYDLVLEPGHMRKLILDEDSRVFGDALAARRAGIEAKLKDEFGVGRIVVLRDFRTGGGYDPLNDPGESAVPMPRLYDSNRVRFVPSSAFIFGATGEDSTGWESDPQLVRQNRMQWFSKEWLLLAKHGCHPAAWIDVTSCASGARANGIEPVDCADLDS